MRFESAVLALFCCASYLIAQNDRGTLTGTVADPAGAVVPNASVVALSLPGALVYEGYRSGRCNCTFSHAYPYAIAPRLGLAYQIDSKTVLRAGWGVSYGQVLTYSYITTGTLLGVGFNSIAFTNPQFGTAAATLSQRLRYDHSQLYTALLNPGLVPYPGQLNSPNYFIDPNDGRPQRIMQWSAGLQQEFGQRANLRLGLCESSRLRIIPVFSRKGELVARFTL